MTVFLKSIIFFSIAVLSLGITTLKKQSMTITRGLEPNITHFGDLEQQFIIAIAKKLENNGYPLDQLTRIHLKKRITTIQDYYTYNEVTFIINPSIYLQGKSVSEIENIGVGWEDPNTKTYPDGSIEFEFGKKVDPDDLVMTLYRLNDSYNNYPLLENHNQILQQVNDVLIATDLEDIKFFASKGILELTQNNCISLYRDLKNEEVFILNIKGLEYIETNPNYLEKMNTVYELKINIETSKIELISSYDPTFFPTPAADIPKPIIKKGD